ncbi:hypothetical protein E2C01_006485 [Portunus trituberculatus]|uniref:Uncharacterized protein n=1 Tax=Portunus trituberculatus TaxID=210409 RepID=A0A5B7CVB6_PORTR|nr:hypothetical protein [Portunus trituberculatus]
MLRAGVPLTFPDRDPHPPRASQLLPREGREGGMREKRKEHEEGEESGGEDIRTQPERRMPSWARERRVDRSGRRGRGKWSWGKRKKRRTKEEPNHKHCGADESW